MLDKSLADLTSLNSFAISALSRRLLILEQPDELTALPEGLPTPTLILGGGSNLLFCEDFEGTLIKPDFKGIQVAEQDDAWLITAAAGENWHDFVTYCVEQGYDGLENLALIPGCVGATPVQNIGAYGVEIKDVCHSVTVFDRQQGEFAILSGSECQFAYRDSIFKHQYKATHIIVNVTFRLPKAWQGKLNYGDLKSLPADASAKQIYDLVCQVRSAKLPDPNALGNAGSFFKNPTICAKQVEQLLLQYPAMPQYPVADPKLRKVAAGWLIDQAGLKGKQVGGAAVHQNQALVLVNKRQAVASDIVDLAWLVRQTVWQKFGIALEHEVRFIGAQGETDLLRIKARE
ncbi:UDP-N-acetylmuramate dehydrogenase [Motilimonas pumila]|uniref:UDP-N-acetylenolpyruvoylglucosamine reductase n=1 Tax=Motilimonas pumila TaxID=2303987 RepID=A0A418YH22_9GAMM|nr:UDP-N-acetylmuramate dehydrogenase [Motilimonas pumila]RJG49385.1 UDP-N-acetylmuramate dehydrogenase [Motilimonas pumila]